jgi:hypothetical protein
MPSGGGRTCGAARELIHAHRKLLSGSNREVSAGVRSNRQRRWRGGPAAVAGLEPCQPGTEGLRLAAGPDGKSFDDAEFLVDLHVSGTALA